jgi:hypothetical protein
MTQQPDTAGIYEAARGYAEKSLPIIPLRGKVPAVKGWQEFVANEINLRLWFGPPRSSNIGLRTGESGYVVIDTDSVEAEAWVRSHCADTPLVARSGAGSTHRYYANPARKEIRNRQGLRRIPGLDVRGHGGFIVLPPSVHPATGKRYEWLTEFRLPSGLPRFSPSWVYERTRRRVRETVLDGTDAMARRAAAYVATIEGAVSGQGGHNKTFRVCCKLTHSPPRGFGLSAEQAWPILLAFNARCSPEWSVRELRHKLDDARKKR